MSGGVDSTACALILREKYDVQGFFMQLGQPDLPDQLKKVQSIAATLGIQLHIVDLQQEFHNRVLDYFSTSYFNGLTPNPCIICNKEIKFGLFLETMVKAGMDMMATGHYAQVREERGSYHLFCGKDATKDQTYFLSRLSQAQLSKILFPLGGMSKESIYDFVESHGFDNFRGCESQDVCFLENTSVGNYLEAMAPKMPLEGPIKSSSGATLGTHKGLFRYTVGQRRGLGISSSAPLYVLRLDTTNNSVIVGSNDELNQKVIDVDNVHWLAETSPDLSNEYTVRIRYSHRGAKAKLSLNRDKQGTIVFNEPQRAITPGQFAVIYDEQELLGSARIT